MEEPQTNGSTEKDSKSENKSLTKVSKYIFKQL